MRQQFFFDESGKSNLASADSSGQDNLVIAGVLIPYESSFWDQAEKSWLRAAQLLGSPGQEYELHASEIYGGRGPWKGINDRRSILDSMINALCDHGIPIYWIGLPVSEMAAIEGKRWRKILFHYIDLFHKLMEARAASTKIEIEVYGDQNEWVKAGSALESASRWPMFSERLVGFHDSRLVHGIQIADIVAHTLYRANKKTKNSTDTQADEYRKMLSRNIIHLE